MLPILLGASPAAADAGGPGAQVPPPPAAVEETAPGEVVPAPLPWPLAPVGGAALGACGDVLGPGDPALPPEVTAAGFVLADLDTGAVLAARAPHARQRPASTLKVLTAMVAIDRLDPDAQVAGPRRTCRSTAAARDQTGGTYTVRQLLTGLLLNSGNDTAQALARAMGGDAPTVAAMTEKAQQLGALDTRPATPSGLDGPGMATSAYDLAVLFRHAMGEPLFAQTVATREIPFPGYGDRPGFRAVERQPAARPATPARWAARPASPTLRGTRSRGRPNATGGDCGVRWCGPRTPRSSTGARPRPCSTTGSRCRRTPPSVGTVVDAAPPPPTASAGTSSPSGTFTAPVAQGVSLPGGVLVPGGTETIAGAAAAAVAGLLLAVVVTRGRRQRRTPAPTPTPSPVTAADSRVGRSGRAVPRRRGGVSGGGRRRGGRGVR